MLKHLTCQTPERFVRIAWISFQPGGDISVGLNDKTFISPRFKGRRPIWNVFNRVTAQFEVSSDPMTLEPVRNPHFTFHAPNYFHLKSDKELARKDDAALFAGICEVSIVLEQQQEMPWLRVTTAPLHQLRSAGLRWSKIPNDDLPIETPSEDKSVKIEVDFIRPQAIGQHVNPVPVTWSFPWGDIAMRVRASLAPPHIATPSWFHSD